MPRPPLFYPLPSLPSILSTLSPMYSQVLMGLRAGGMRAQPVKITDAKHLAWLIVCSGSTLQEALDACKSIVPGGTVQIRLTL